MKFGVVIRYIVYSIERVTFWPFDRSNTSRDWGVDTTRTLGWFQETGVFWAAGVLTYSCNALQCTAVEYYLPKVVILMSASILSHLGLYQVVPDRLYHSWLDWCTVKLGALHVEQRYSPILMIYLRLWYCVVLRYDMKMNSAIHFRVFTRNSLHTRPFVAHLQRPQATIAL